VIAAYKKQKNEKELPELSVESAPGMQPPKEFGNCTRELEE